MNWKKRKKFRKIAHAHGKSHYYEWRSVIKALCHLDLYMTYSKEKRSKSWRVLAGKKVERNHPTDTVNVEVTVQEFNKPSRMKRQYDPNGISDAITDGVLCIVEGESTPAKRDPRLRELMKYRGKPADIEFDITDGEAIEYPNSAVIDLRNVAITPRVNISPEGEVKIVGFGLEKKKEASEVG